MQQRTLLEQTHRPAGAGRRDRPQLPHPARQSRCLGVDHAGRRLLPQPVPRLVGRRQAAAQQIRQPLLQLLRAAGDPLGPALGAPPRGRRVGRARTGAGRASPGRIGLLRRPSATAVQPLPGPVRHLRRAEHRLVRCPEQQQPQRVLARELTAGATALVRGARRIDHRLIRLASAPLAQPPHRTRSVAARAGPWAGRTEPAAGFA